MSDKKLNPNEEKVTIGCYISLALAIVLLCVLIYLLAMWVGRLMMWFIGLF